MLDDDELLSRARIIFDDIRATRGTDYINNFWRALAHDPDNLKTVWSQLKAVMAHGALDPVVKEMLYIAVSTANGCDYYIHSHTASAMRKDMTPKMHNELLAVIGMTMQTNGLARGSGVDLDDSFRL